MSQGKPAAGNQGQMCACRAYLQGKSLISVDSLVYANYNSSEILIQTDPQVAGLFALRLLVGSPRFLRRKFTGASL
jgi:hypothetical protein